MSTAATREAAPSEHGVSGPGRGTVQMLVARVFLLVSGFGVSIILARALGPAEFGVYGVVMSFLVWFERIIGGGNITHTNDGDLTNRLTHPRFGHEKEYRVLLARRPDEKQLEAWKRGVILEDGYKTQPVNARYETGQGKGAWVRVVMGEGRKRQIRETCKQLGLPVVKILRIRIGELRLGNLKPGQWRALDPREVEELKGNSPARRTNRR